MKRIDFLGAPGAGKTTLYRELIKQRGMDNRWLTPYEARIKIFKIQSFKNAHSAKGYIKALILRLGFLKRIHRYCTDNKNSLEILLANQDKYQEILELCTKYVGENSEEPVLRIKRAAWLLENLEDISIIENHRLPDTVIFDESLLQKIFTWIISNKYDNYKNLESQLRAMPNPDAFIYCYCDFDTSIKRLDNRDRTNLLHRFLDRDRLVQIQKFQIDYFDKAVKALLKIGIKGIEVNTLNPLKVNVRNINEFIRNIQA